MTSKTALVTGGTSGVGLSIVHQLAKHNFNVFFIGTNEEKGNEISEELNRLYPTISQFVNLDLSKLDAVIKFADQFVQKYSTLDLLANIAGVVLLKQEFWRNCDKTFAIGYLSAFILSTKLVPLLENGNNPRIINVSGNPSHVLNTKFDFENMDFKHRYNGFKTAIATVHAKTVLTKILSEKLLDKRIDVNAFHPGIIKSNLTRNMPSVLKFLSKLAIPFMANESKNGIYTCLSEEIIGQTGQLFVKKKSVPLHFDEQYQHQLWTMTNEIIEGVF